MIQAPFTGIPPEPIHAPHINLWKNVLLQLFRDLTYVEAKRDDLQAAYQDALRYVNHPSSTHLRELCAFANVSYTSVVKAIQSRTYMRVGQTNVNLARPKKPSGER